MIVRISTEGQYRVDSATLDRVNEVDQRLVQAVEDSDADEFSRLLGELESIVRRKGQPVPAGEIVESDLVLPPPDTSLEEARRLFAVDGLVPES